MPVNPHDPLGKLCLYRDKDRERPQRNVSREKGWGGVRDRRSTNLLCAQEFIILQPSQCSWIPWPYSSLLPSFSFWDSGRAQGGPKGKTQGD